MQISWLHFAPALALLLIPIGWFNRGARHRAIHSEWHGYWPRIMSLPQHGIDLVRAAGGGWLLAHALEPSLSAKGLWVHAPLALETLVLVAAAIVQSVVCHERDSVHAPFAFLIGLTAGFLPPLVAGVALVLTLTVTMGTRAPSLFFAALAGSSIVFGFLFLGGEAKYVIPPLPLAAFLPWLLSLLLHRELVVTHRPRPVTGKHSPLRD